MTRQGLSRQMMGTSEAQRLRLQLVAADFLERMGSRIREQRDSLGLSRAEVARRMPGKVNENQVYRWEKGLHQPNPDTLQALAGVLGVDVGVFMAAEPEKVETPLPFEETQLDRMERKLDKIITTQAEAVQSLDERLAHLVREALIREREESQRNAANGQQEPESPPGQQ